MTISIITAIHNGLALNILFNESLKKYTYHPYELIIIDNDSSDGSREYFEKEGAIVIKNKGNFSYPYCQNQGIEIAKGDYLFFLNNDLIVGANWDKIMIETSLLFQLDIASAADNGQTGNKQEDKMLSRRWKYVKNPIYATLGTSMNALRLMFRFMYGNWDKFCEKRTTLYRNKIVKGLVGANIMMTRKAIDTIGLWDERIQDADLDLLLRIKERVNQYGDIRPCHIIRGAYIHHFNRMTIKYGKSPASFVDKQNLISLEEKWGISI